MASPFKKYKNVHFICISINQNPPLTMVLIYW